MARIAWIARNRWPVLGWILVSTAALVLLATGPHSQSSQAQEEPAADSTQRSAQFQEVVLPLLQKHCASCHGPEEQNAGLRLDSAEAIRQGGDSGNTVVPGHPEQSKLATAVGFEDPMLRMPPDGKLAAEEIQALTDWIKAGAPGLPSLALAEDNSFEERITQGRRYWAFQPLAQPKPPTLPAEYADQSAAGPIDSLHLAALAESNLRRAPAADKLTLLRRLSFDLRGLPPTLAEIEAFQSDTRPDAYERLVDRFLASPQFGERFGRHWLDLVRYAETRGHEFDYLIPNAYQYRDYVIRACNADLPYDQWVTEHVAGDLLAQPRIHPANGWNESVLATGFWHLGEEVHSPVDIRLDETERNDNKIDVFTKTFMGLTVSCARCHDHKFDPIKSKDYYALSGYIISSQYEQVRFEGWQQNSQVAVQLEQLYRTHNAPLLVQFAEALAASGARVQHCLLAARDVLLAAPEPPESNPQAASLEQSALAAAAAAHGLSAEVLSAWVKECRSAKQMPAHPLFAWVQFAADARSQDVSWLREQWTSWLQSVRQTANASQNSQAETGQNPTVLWQAEQFAVPAGQLAHGFAFGQTPTQPGQMVWGDGGQLLPGGIAWEQAVRKDPFWDILQIAPNQERESSAVNWIQSGRTVRIPKHTLTGGKLYYLVRGSGHAFAEIDSHRMVVGPLHGASVTHWTGDNQLRWVEQDLSAYTGHRVAVQFTPYAPEELPAGASGEFQLLQVVEAAQMPPLPAASHLAARTFLDCDVSTAETTAARLAQLQQQQTAQLCLRLSHSLAANADADFKSGLVEDDRAAWEVASWWLAHAALWADDAEPSVAVWRQSAQAFADARQQLQGQVVRQSKLAPAMVDGSGLDEHVLLRGKPHSPGELAARGMPTVLVSSKEPAPSTEAASGGQALQGSGRLALAQKLTTDAQGLVARVMANRLWKHLFGRGLVSTADNFGALGELPTLPLVLEYLAWSFQQQDWSVKQLIREIVLSDAYQMQSHLNELSDTADPGNRLWHRRELRRLEGEAIRDAVLQVSGTLRTELYGPSVEVYLTPFMEGRGRPGQSGPLDGDGRRSIYLKVRRNFLPDLLTAFDLPVPSTTQGKRHVTNVPAQALAMLNSPLVVEESHRLGQRLAALQHESVSVRLNRLYLQMYARPAAEEEIQAVTQFMQSQAAAYGCAMDDARVWADTAHVLLNVKEFVFVP